MAELDLLQDCKLKIHNVQTAANSVIFDEFENEYLLENYLQCLKDAQIAIEKRIDQLREK